MKSVVDLAEQVKDYAAAGKTIAPVENGTTAEGSYAVGEQFIREGVLYKAKTSITAGDALTLNTNYELADNLDTQIGNVKQALSDEVVTRSELGAHNLLKLDLEEIKSLNTDGTWSGNAYTLNGVTFTVNSDYTISTSGTASANTTFYLHRYSTWTKLPLKFLSGCPSGGGMDKYILRLVRGGAFSKNDTGEGVLLDQDDIASPVDVTIVVLSGNNMSGLTFEPMIRLATDSNPTYQPYAMTNKELTDSLNKEVLFFTSVACAATTGNFATVSNSDITADHVVVDCVFADPSAIITNVTWTTSNGSLVLNGTCASATTATITLAMKGN